MSDFSVFSERQSRFAISPLHLMKATHEFCKAYPSKPEDPDAVSKRFAELDNFTVLSD